MFHIELKIIYFKKSIYSRMILFQKSIYFNKLRVLKHEVIMRRDRPEFQFPHDRASCLRIS